MKSATTDVYSIVTERIITQLEQGIIPWLQPWRSLGPPRNFVTGRPYRGINHLLLSFLNYPSNEFLTFKQVKDFGGSIKKGEKAHLVVLWTWIDETDAEDKPTGKKHPYLRYYYVFNTTQCTGIPERQHAQRTLNADTKETCEQVVSNMPNCPKIVHNEDEAYYHVWGDFINMPKEELFESYEGYYATLFHELVHATGSEYRLAREELMSGKAFGSESYSIEELTAEIGAAYLCSHTGIIKDRIENSVGYIQHWLKQLRDDKKFVVYAASHAQKAVDYILNTVPASETNSETEKTDAV